SAAELRQLTAKDISHPEDRDLADGPRARLLAREIESARLEKRYLRKDGRQIWVNIAIAMERDAEGRPLYAISVLDDITERKCAEAALQEAHEELKRSNSELEQFAYVASHDLQEPLRMVSSYAQLLGRRYGDKGGPEAGELMGSTVDGEAGMKPRIEDLLACSRVGPKSREFKPIELEKSLSGARARLKAAIDESGAAVPHDPLPTLPAGPAQLA